MKTPPKPDRQPQKTTGWAKKAREILVSYNMPDSYLEHETQKWLKLISQAREEERRESIKNLEKDGFIELKTKRTFKLASQKGDERE